MDTEKIHLRLPKGLKKKAEEFAASRGSNLSQLIRQSLIEKIKYAPLKTETNEKIKFDRHGNVIWTEETWAAHCAETGAITHIEID